MLSILEHFFACAFIGSQGHLVCRYYFQFNTGLQPQVHLGFNHVLSLQMLATRCTGS